MKLKRTREKSEEVTGVRRRRAPVVMLDSSDSEEEKVETKVELVTCVICLEEVTDQQCHTDSCDHIYHLDCI